MSSFSLRTFLLVSTLGLAAACSKQEQDRATAAVKETYEDSKAAMTRTWEKVKGYTFEKRGEFEASAKAASERMDAQVSELRANYSEAKASASRKAAMEELRNSEADYKEKTRALATASADTWEAAKQNVILAWDKLQASYYKARQD